MLDRLAQEVLLRQPAQPKLVGKAGGELGDAVVEEREAALDRVAHQHPVALRVEQIALQEGRDLEVLRPPERRHLPEPRRQARLQPLGGIAALRRRARRRPVEQPSSRERVREADAVAVERVVGLGQPLAVEADEECAGALEVLADECVQPGEEKRAELGLRLARPEVAHRVLAEEVVAAEELVRAFAGGYDLQPGVLDRAREAQERRGRGPERRLLRQLDRLRQELGDVAGADGHAGEARDRGRR